jgi:hypothetical protein
VGINIKTIINLLIVKLPILLIFYGLIMNNFSEQQKEELVKVILWKLYLIPDDDTCDKYSNIWDSFAHQYESIAFNICSSLANLFQQMLESRLGISHNSATIKDDKLLEFTWQKALNFLITESVLSQGEKEELQAIFQKNIEQILSTLLQGNVVKPPSQPIPTLKITENEEKLDQNLLTQSTTLETKETPNHQPEVITPKPDSIQAKPIKRLVDHAQWQYLPLPENEPDPHSEFDAKFQSNITPNFNLIGARVRGKKHKHEGTHCDDWFEFSSSNNWTIIAVSDGAGSKKFSRVGARVACKSAVTYLEDALRGLKLEKRQLWTEETFKRDQATGKFAETDLEEIQQALHQAMKTAYLAIEMATKERYNSYDHGEILGNRRLNITDLSATLLLAIHTTVNYKDTDYSLIFTCQVGDGAIAAIDHNENLSLLAIPDSGEFSGQTDFLTSKNKLESQHLMSKTFAYFKPLKALMIMTDGVADDYFPSAPEMLRLYGDLLINKILPHSITNFEEINEALRCTRLGSLTGLKDAQLKFKSTIQRLVNSQETIQKIELYSLAEYSRELGISVIKILKSPALLSAVYSDFCNLENSDNLDLIQSHLSSAEKLCLWLDSYTVKGSFDDRTLVILYSELKPADNIPLK